MVVVTKKDKKMDKASLEILQPNDDGDDSVLRFRAFSCENTVWEASYVSVHSEEGK